MNADPQTGAQARAIPPAPMVGQTLKHFRIESLLGEGGMGLVYRAYDTRLHRPVAVKLLAAKLLSDPEQKQRFFQEARAAARINHPAVAQIFDADEEGGVTFIVMELVEGKTVRQLLGDKELDVLGAMDIGIQVAEGLARAHELGIVHRDIKPANVMRTPAGHAKILDFGLAKLLDTGRGPGPAGTQVLDHLQGEPTRSGMVLGTPAYMSPEQVRGLPVDARTDIFALGVLLFEMATGQSPFHRPNPMDALHAAAFEETPPMNSIRAHIPQELQCIVSRCLRKQPEDRYSNAKLLAEDLRRARRDTEAGLAQKVPWRQRLADAWQEIRHLSPSRSVWYVLAGVACLWALYWAVRRVGLWTLLLLGFIGIYVYRQMRNRLPQVQELFVRRVATIPEVRLIQLQGRHFNVVVDGPVAQLYGRINDHLRACNQQLFYGEPMTLSILPEITGEQMRAMLASPGVQYVREDAVVGDIVER